MMTTRLLLFLVFLLSARGGGASTEGIVLNEIFYDLPGIDGDGEFVELYNAGPVAIDIGGWRIEFVDGGGAAAKTIWTAPGGRRVEPGEYLLLGGASRGLPEELQLGGAIGNGPDAIRLLSLRGTVDIVGYGEGTPLCEGSPAPDAPPGSSLARRPDGADRDDNRTDIAVADPTPGAPNFHRIDIAISIADRQALPCAGGEVRLRGTLRNAGIERFDGVVLVETGIAGAGWTVSDPIAIDCAIGPLEEQAFSLVAGMASEGRIDALLRATTPGDGRSSNDTCRASLYASPGPVVVSEIMGRPAGGEEWIELQAREFVDLEGWSIRDAAGSWRIVAGETLPLAPGAFVLLVRDPEAFRTAWPGCSAAIVPVAGGWCVLNDGGDTIELADGAGVLIERVSWGMAGTTERGRSLERVSAGMCSAEPGGIWQRCHSKEGGTPGRVNAGRIPEQPKEGTLAVEPNPYSPARDGETVVVATIRSGERGYDLQIFDLDGREVRRLCGAPAGAGVCACRWDGRDGRGRPVATGFYIVVAAFHDEGGVVCRVEKAGIAVAGD
ncbi:MAG: lamin tail domain-containing protein [Candidatus Krumholzibacteriota bacterium]|nr:lamin tail domain-containing protein [Candidatus Krumholzibacteriota bacterium]